jgi:hypothetical protein
MKHLIINILTDEQNFLLGTAPLMHCDMLLSFKARDLERDKTVLEKVQGEKKRKASRIRRMRIQFTTQKRLETDSTRNKEFQDTKLKGTEPS